MTAQLLCCPHCGGQVFRKSASGTRYKARTPIVVLHKSGELEINCSSCKRGIILPTGFKDGASPALRKAVLTVRKG